MKPNDPASGSKPVEDSLKTLDRLDLRLWGTALLLIFVMGIGVLSFMFPTVFWPREELLLKAPQRAFYGLCVLLGLTLAYLFRKQALLRQRRRRQFVVERRRVEQELTFKALHDSLTGLANRALFLDRLRLALDRAKRNSENQFAVIYLDLDHFKLLNDSLGHQCGDELLVEFSKRLKRSLRAVDTVARLGGDEFVVLLDNVKQISEVSQSAERVHRELTLPFTIGGQEIFTSASMGISLSSAGYEQAEDLLRDADTAMYRAKAQGRGQHAIFDASMHENAVKLMNLKTELRQAVDHHELTIQYQPIMLLSTGQIAGLEALIRWRHPDRGLISPAEFIPFAESVGLIVPITRLLLTQVCRQINSWTEECPASWPLSVSVNLPAMYLTKEERVEEIISIVSEHRLRPQSIRLEITETQWMERAESIKAAFLRLSNFGIRVYIDDFGTGFSSLSYLSIFQVDALKIDQTFIQKSNGIDRNAAIVRSINSLGNNLGIDVIAEGIETEEQLNFLREIKCQYGQGYYFARPLDPETVSRSLKEWFPASRDKQSLVSRLSSFELFAGLGREGLLEIAQISEEVQIPDGTIVIHEGGLGDLVYLMEDGSVGIYQGAGKDAELLTVLNAPTVFGEMALLTSVRPFQWEGTRTASVKALGQLRAITIPIIPFLSIIRREAVLKENLEQLAFDRFYTGPNHQATISEKQDAGSKPVSISKCHF